MHNNRHNLMRYKQLHGEWSNDIKGYLTELMGLNDVVDIMDYDSMVGNVYRCLRHMDEIVSDIIEDATAEESNDEE